MPLPFGDGIITDEPTRSTYFDRRAANVLYQLRGHKTDRIDLGNGVVVDGAELCRGDSIIPATVLFHVQLPSTGDTAIAALHRLTHASDGRHAFSDAVSSCGANLQIVAGLARLYSLAFLSFTHGPSDVAPAHLEVTPAQGWLWLAASATPSTRYPPGPISLASELGQVIELSADWSALVLRTGAGFVWMGSDNGSSASFARQAETLVRTVYADTLLIAEWQRAVLADLADDLSEIESAIDSYQELETYGERLAVFESGCGGNT